MGMCLASLEPSLSEEVLASAILAFYKHMHGPICHWALLRKCSSNGQETSSSLVGGTLIRVV